MMVWWKYIAIALLAYALTAGLLVPLKPGIESCVPTSIESGGKATISVVGYNSSYSQNHVNAWFKLNDERFLSADTIIVHNNRQMDATFHLPVDFLGDKRVVEATLIVHEDIKGTTVLPSAVFISSNENLQSDSTIIPNGWTSERPQNLAIVTGFLFPYRNILVETIRNTFYHISLWFAMFIILLLSVVRSVQYLKTRSIQRDQQAEALVSVGVLFGLLGLVTGSIWAKATWGTYWTTDVKLNMAAISMLIYVGYIILRSAIEDRERKATVGAAYAIFAYCAMIPLLFVVPRLTDSLHPGNGGNPGLGGEDLDHTLRIVFYPAIMGFTLLGLWMAQLFYRLSAVKERMLQNQK